MKVNRVFLIGTVAAISAMAVSSCAYDPHYSNPSYSSGYGHGYGSRGFTTTHFVRTSNSRWGYDPYARCYYDYSRRSYYDPYLNGYYPAGYRPTYVYGAPHPHGWRTGYSHIAPPSRIHDHRLNNYQNRGEQYRSLNNNWSRNVQVNRQEQSRDTNRDRYSSYGQDSGSRSGSFIKSSQGNQPSRNYDQRQNTYVNDTQKRVRTEPRMAQPKEEFPKASRQEQKSQSERYTRPNRESDSNKERGGRKSEEERPESLRQLENRGSNRIKSEDHRRNEQPTNRGSETVDERIAKRR
jgi:hypothetical protein